MPLVSVDEAGRPHPALVSYGELLAPRPDLIRLVIWESTKTAGNLRRSGHATLIFAGPDIGVYYVKTSARQIPERNAGSLVLFELDVDEVIEDLPTSEEVERSVRLTSAIQFAPPPSRSAPAFQRARRLLQESTGA